MNRLKIIYDGSCISISRFDHGHDREHCSDGDEICHAYAINFVESGTFELGIKNNRWTMSGGAVFLSRPGALHRYQHIDRSGSDVCVSARYSTELFVEDKIDDTDDVGAKHKWQRRWKWRIAPADA
jgi:AraC-like ligand binding domain